MTNFQRTAIFWTSVTVVLAAVIFTGLKTVGHQIEILKNVKLPELKISDEEMRTLRNSPFYKEVIDDKAEEPLRATENEVSLPLPDGLRQDTSLQ